MRLYALFVLHKEPTSGKATILKSASDVSSFAFFYRKNVGEFMSFTSRLLAERSETPSRNCITEKEYRLRCFVRPDNLCGVCVTDQEYEDRVGFVCLSKVLDQFAQAVPSSKWPQIHKEEECDFSKLNELLVKWQNPREADALTRVQDEVEETKVVLHNTMQSVLERGEKLDDLIQASESLSNQSKQFYTQARKMNKCCNYV